jgi:hypothetical protein
MDGGGRRRRRDVALASERATPHARKQTRRLIDLKLVTLRKIQQYLSSKDSLEELWKKIG